MNYLLCSVIHKLYLSGGYSTTKNFYAIAKKLEANFFQFTVFCGLVICLKK